MNKRYLLSDFNTDFPSTPKVNSILASVASSSKLSSEDASLVDVADRKVEAALKRSYAAANFGVRAASYSAYASQVSLKDFQQLYDCLQDKRDPSELLSNMELLAKFLSDAIFDSFWASSAASSASIAGRRLLWLKSWKRSLRNEIGKSVV